jgi:flavorubredoxin
VSGERDRVADDAAHNTLPRELLPGLFWLGSCVDQLTPERKLHTYNSAYLVTGERESMLVETGCAQELPITIAQLERLLAEGHPPLRWIFCTHQETPHSAGLGWLFERYPEVRLVGEVRDYHLYFPEFVDRFEPLPIGAEIDLGGTSLRICESIIRDLPSTVWGFDTARRVLFPGDGFAYAHYHDAEHCGRTAEEATGLPIPAMTSLFAEAALYWTRFTDMHPYVERLDEFLEHDLGDVALIAPTHGLPITDLAATMPEVRAGLLGGPVA